MKLLRGLSANQPFRIALLYLFASSAWIFITDRVVQMLTLDRDTLFLINVLKGFFFLLASASIIFIAFRQLYRSNQALRVSIETRNAALATSQSTLRKSEERLQHLLSNLPAVTWSIAPNGTTTFVSENVEQVVGYTAAEFYSAQSNLWLQLLHPDDSAMVNDRLTRLFALGEPYDIEYRVRHAKGHYIWIHDRALRAHVEDGVQHADGMSFEVTQRKEMEQAQRRAELALAKSEMHFRILVEQASDGIFVADSEGHYVDVNSAGAEMLGYSREEILRFAIRDVVTEEEIPRIAYEVGRLSDSRVIISNWKFLRKDGRFFFGEVAARRLPDGRLQAIVRDVTERLKSEQELRESKQWLDAAMEAAQLAVWSYDLTTGEFVTNSRGQDILGVPQRSTLTVFDLLNRVLPEDREKLQNLWPQSSDLDMKLEFRVVSPTGVRWLYACGSGIRDDAGNALRTNGVLMDITDRKLAEEQLKLLQEELQQAQKMEAIGQLAGGVAHDFNNLLHVVMSYAELANFKLPARSPVKRHLAMILEAAKRATDVTGQLLAFGRKQILKPRVLCLNERVLNTSKMLSRLIGEDILLQTQLEDNLANTEADPGQIEQIIMNLAVNARDAMPDGGKLLISTATVRDVQLRSGTVSGTSVQLSVSDTGCGMSDEVKARIFEPFFTTKAQGKGTGLGLATVYGIVKQSGGFIECTSEAGRGTRFDIYFPALDLIANLCAEEDETPTVENGTGTILLVEDDDAVRESAREMLQRIGYHVLVALSGNDALELSAGFSGAIDLVLTDVVMPGMSGSELSASLRARRPDLHFLFMSGYTDDAMLRQGITQSEVPFLQKPFSLQSLALKVKQAMRSPASV